jgi:hypothetical protein
MQSAAHAAAGGRRQDADAIATHHRLPAQPPTPIATRELDGWVWIQALVHDRARLSSSMISETGRFRALLHVFLRFR